MHRYGIALGWLVLTAVAVAVVQRMPAVYSADSLILIASQKIPERFVPSTVTDEAPDRLATISQQVLSNTELQRIIEEDDLYREERARHPLDEVVETMRMDIGVHLVKGMASASAKPDAFRISYSGRQPAVVAQVTNQLANLFIEENLRTRESEAEGTSEFVGTELAEAKKKLDSLETAIREFKATHNGELPEQQGAIQSALERLRMEQVSANEAISRAEESKTTLENTLRMAHDTLDMLMRPRPASASTATSPSGAGAAAQPVPAGPKKQSEILQAQLDVMLGRYGEGHPDVKRLRADINLAKAAEAKEAAEASRTKSPAQAAEKVTASDTAAQALAKAMMANPADVGQANERIATVESQIAAVNDEIDRRKADRERIANEITERQAKLTSVPMREQELTEITRDYDVTKANYLSLLNKQQSAEMSTDMERRQKSERFTILDPAHAPQTPSSPNRPFYDATSSALALFFALACGIGLEMRKGNLLGEWELPADIPVLARVPQISQLAVAGSVGRPWAGWSTARWVIVVSVVLISLMGLAAARFYLGSGF
jgi:polysaccharide chain length determinant protein (PEP-CTERM system associated)